MADIWLISDTHFNHANILNFRGVEGDTIRDFQSLEEMNETMIDRWNEVVKPQDKVYHLGDVLFGDRQKDGPGVLSRLKGHKRLVVGNHDVIHGNPMQNVLHKYFDKITMWRMMPEHGILMTHVPVHPSTLGEGRFEGVKGKMVNVHGHIHENKSPEGPYFCVCVEHIDYRPMHLDEVKEKINA